VELFTSAATYVQRKHFRHAPDVHSDVERCRYSPRIHLARVANSVDCCGISGTQVPSCPVIVLSVSNIPELSTRLANRAHRPCLRQRAIMEMNNRRVVAPNALPPSISAVQRQQLATECIATSGEAP
jgi:hypothetical protein